MPKRKTTKNKKTRKGPSSKRGVRRTKKKSGSNTDLKPERKEVRYQADIEFELFNEIRALLIKVSPESYPEVERKIKKIGKIKLAIISGAFLNINDSRVDLLLVGDGVNFKRLTKMIKNLEVDLGKEIRYVILSVAEFKYRYEMYDRFLRDVLISPHEKIINKIKV